MQNLNSSPAARIAPPGVFSRFGLLLLTLFTVAGMPREADAQNRHWVAAPHEYSELSAWAFGDGADGGLWQIEAICAAGEAFLVVGPVLSSTDTQGGPVRFDIDGLQLQRPGRYIRDAMDGWRVVADEQLLEAIRSGTRVSVTTPQFGTARFGLRGSSQAIDEALGNCSAGRGANPRRTEFFEFSGMAGGYSLDIPLTMPALFVEQEAKAFLETTCEGPAEFTEPGAVQAAHVDNDEDPDILLDWSKIRCVNRPFSRGGGFCGMQYCHAHVFATGAYRPGSAPMSFLHIGLFLEEGERPSRLGAMRTDGTSAMWVWRHGRFVSEN